MKIKKIPMRTCVVTKEKLEKKDLLRIVRTPEGLIKVDETGKLNGRGAYLKKDEAVIKKAENSQVLERILGVQIPSEVYLEAIEKCKE